MKTNWKDRSTLNAASLAMASAITLSILPSCAWASQAEPICFPRLQSSPSVPLSEEDRWAEVGTFFLKGAILIGKQIPSLKAPASAAASIFDEIDKRKLSIEKIWSSLQPRIEQLINSKIQEKDLVDLQANLNGLKSVVEVYHANPNPGTLNIAIAEAAKDVELARKDNYEVAELPFFSLFANTYALLLVQGIRDGGSGTQGYQELFNKHFPEKGATEFYDSISASLEKSEVVDIDTRDNYIAWVKHYYTAGRLDVSKKNSINFNSSDASGRLRIATGYRAISDYDRVYRDAIDQAAVWPFLQSRIPENILDSIKYREVYFGPYCRAYSANGLWDAKSIPQLQPSPVLGVAVRYFNDIDDIALKYPGGWKSQVFSGLERVPGKPDPEVLDLTDEHVNRVYLDIQAKVNSVVFYTDKARKLEAFGKLREQGSEEFETMRFYASSPGRVLSSVSFTAFSEGDRPGAEGIILGFNRSADSCFSDNPQNCFGNS